MPYESKGNILLTYSNVIEQHYRIGVEGVFIEYVHSKTVAGKVIVVANYCILIKCICFEAVKRYFVITKRNVFFGNDAKSIVQHSFECAFRELNK